MKELAIAGTDLRRLLRWRANVFFLFLLPMLIILLLGAAFGGSSARIGVVGGTTAWPSPRRRHRCPSVRRGPPLRRRARPRAGGRARSRRSRPGRSRRLRRACERGPHRTLRYFGRPDSSAQQLAPPFRRWRPTRAPCSAPRSSPRASAASLRPGPRAGVGDSRARPAGDRRADGTRRRRVSARRGSLRSGASTQLLLFVFLNSLSAAVWLIETRRLGIARRMLSTPTSTRSILGGVLLGRLAIALLQALIIVVGSSLFFGVGWGDPLGTDSRRPRLLPRGHGRGDAPGQRSARPSSRRRRSHSCWACRWPPSAARWCRSRSSRHPFGPRRTSRRTPGPTTPSPSCSCTAAAWPTSSTGRRAAAFAGVAIALATWRLRRAVVA